MKRIFNIITWVLTFSGILILLGFINKKSELVRCGELIIDIDEAGGNRFVVKKDVEEAVKNMGYVAEAVSACMIDIHHLEHVLNNNPVIEKANVYSTIDGNIEVKLVQREPIVRIFSRNGDSYYIDKNGFLMPLSNRFTSRSLVVNGNLNEPWVLRYHTNMGSLISSSDSARQRSILQDIYKLSKYIHEHPFWKAQITQVFVNENEELELIPRVGNHTILLGGVKDLEEKFDKLMVFYKNGLSKTGWNEYTTINLKYKNQVVCTKQIEHGSI